MANIPELKSKEQYVGDLIDGFLARQPHINDLSQGSVISSIFQAVGQILFRSNADIITMLDALSVDRAVGESLQRLAKDRNVPILPALPSSGRVDITDTTFTKISSTVYSGQPAPVAGSLSLYVSDASKFPTSGGTIYIGRGTNNVEGPLTYTTVLPISGGAYWQIVLAGTSPTTKFHNIGEGVVLGRGGNRLVGTGTSVQTPQGSSTTSVSFITTSNVTILDGEVVAKDVPVICSSLGTLGNVPRGAITEAVGLSFKATVINNIAFSNGREADTDDDIRTRIKAYEQAKTKGTEQAIKFSCLGIIAPDELKKVQSAAVVRYADGSAALVFDDGSGYEPAYNGIGIETVIDSATGGERELQLRQKPVAQCRIKNVNSSPYNMVDASYIAVSINDEIKKHQFFSSDFKVPSSATAYEIASSINGDPNIHFLASTAENGTKVVVYPRFANANKIEVTGTGVGEIDANEVLGFPLRPEESLRLYVNDQPLHQDGLYASVYTRDYFDWSPAIIPGETLTYSVDGTPEITITLNNTDFQAVEDTATVSSSTSIDIWATVLNNLMAGVTVQVNGTKIEFISNRGNNDSAKIEITGGSLKDKVFTINANIYAEGLSPDFTLNKQTGQVALANTLSANDRVTVGTQNTRGSVMTSAIPNGPAAAGRVWMIIDGNAINVVNSLQPNTELSFSKVGTKITITGQSPALVAEGFDDVREGDWLLIWANPSDPQTLIDAQGFWRVESAEVGQLVVDDGAIVRNAFVNPIVPISERIVIVRSLAPMQTLDFSPGSLTNFATEVKNKIVGVDTQIIGSRVKIATKSYASSIGEVFVVAFDQVGASLSLPLGTANKNVTPHVAYIATSDSESNVPSFVHSVFGAANSDDQFAEVEYKNLGGTEDEFVELLEKYDISAKKSIIDSNKPLRALVHYYDDAINRLYLKPPRYMKGISNPPIGTPIQQDDRYFLRSSYKFDSTDTLSAIVDGDATVKSYTLPVARKLLVSGHSAPNTQSFSASDLESSLNLSDQASFYDFDFSDFRVWRKSQQTLSKSGFYSLKFVSNNFGPSGDMMRIGFTYPKDFVVGDMSHESSVSEVIDLSLVLPVTSVITPNWTLTSSFTTTKSSVGGKDTITFTYRAGTAPDFIAAGVTVGTIVSISESTSFLSVNKDIRGRVSSVTSTSFAVEIPSDLGKGIADDIAFSAISNQTGTISVTTATPHGLTSGDSIGLWSTASTDNGISYPLEISYTANVTGANTFTVSAPLGLPGGNIQNCYYNPGNYTVTVITTAPHNVLAGQVIRITGNHASYNGIHIVNEIVSSTQFRYNTYMASNPGSQIGGVVDFQSYKQSSSAVINSATRTGTPSAPVTISTTTAHGFSPGDMIAVSGIVIDPWSNAATYAPGDLVRYSGVNYRSLTLLNFNRVPTSYPSDWQATTQDLGGYFTVETVPTATQFTYIYNEVSAFASGTGGSVIRLSQSGRLSRGINAADNLQFAQAQATAQQVSDYVAANLSDKISVEILGAPGDIISSSTEDLGIPTNYLSGNITSLTKFISSRKIIMDSDIAVPAGSHILVAGLTGGNSAYNGSYVVLAANTIPGPIYQLTLQSSVFASSSSTAVVSGTFTGSTSHLMMVDGENAIDSNDLQSLLFIPQFFTKRAWVNAPAIGEEVRLVAITADHLSRFWNKLVVTGISNVSNVELSEYGRQVQLSTQTFGNVGSIQIAGGSANTLTAATVGAALQLSNKVGKLNIPYELRSGFVPKQWINVINQVRQNKIIDTDATTTVQLNADNIVKTAGAGTFQTLRPATHSLATEIKIEKHGDFYAFISVDGPSFGLSSAGVVEGDWVRIKNYDAAPWLTATAYTLGTRRNYDNKNYTCIVALSTPSLPPDQAPLEWEVQEFNSANQGIFQIVRTFGDNTFWVESSVLVEEYLTLGNVNNLKFYSYDSVMPGDTLVITTNVLGSVNVGRYVVSDETDIIPFPTATTVYLTSTVPNPPGSPVLLGDSYKQVNFEEKNPISLWKRIMSIGPESNVLAITVDSPELIDRVSSSLGSYIVGSGKMGFSESVQFGVDGYKYYTGIPKELNKIIYGDASDILKYPGVRAAGTSIDIKWAITKRIQVGLSVRLKSGVPFTELRERIKAAAAGYVNSLGVGEQVSLSRIVAAAGSVPGVVSVAVTSPTYDASNDLITVGADERAFIIDPTVDITLSVVG